MWELNASRENEDEGTTSAIPREMLERHVMPPTILCLFYFLLTPIKQLGSFHEGAAGPRLGLTSTAHHPPKPGWRVLRSSVPTKTTQYRNAEGMYTQLLSRTIFEAQNAARAKKSVGKYREAVATNSRSWTFVTVIKLVSVGSRSVGRSIGQSVGRSVGRLVGRSIGRSVGRSLQPSRKGPLFVGTV